jgi:hypothetical protein
MPHEGNPLEDVEVVWPGNTAHGAKGLLAMDAGAVHQRQSAASVHLGTTDAPRWQKASKRLGNDWVRAQPRNSPCASPT